MTEKRVGMVIYIAGSVPELDSNAALALIQRAEDLGIDAIWSTSGRRQDAITLFASAAVGTKRILLGTAVLQTFSRHPVVVAQQVQVLGQIAPGRFRLGVGSGGREGMESAFGVDFRAPLGHLREYLTILKSAVQGGSVEFQGKYYQANANFAGPLDMPIMGSALGVKAFQICGAQSDGAISWVCPRNYLKDVALPTMEDGANEVGKPTPPLIAHTFVAVHDDVELVRSAVREQFGHFPKSDFYQKMFIAAGFPEAAQGIWSDDMIESVTLWGSQKEVVEKIHGLLSLGAAEVMASPLPIGPDIGGSLDSIMRALGQASKELRT